MLDRIMARFGFTEVPVSEHDILDGMAWLLVRNSCSYGLELAEPTGPARRLTPGSAADVVR